jgi:hypothetical protein
MRLGYAFIGLGTVLSFVAAVVPHHTAGHRLLFDVFAAGITPYLVFALVVALSRRAVTNAAGAVLVLVHGALVVNERFVDKADYSDATIYWVPLVLGLLLMPLVFRALREPWHG